MAEANPVERLVFAGALVSRAAVPSKYVIRNTRSNYPNAEVVTKDNRTCNMGKCESHTNCNGHMGLFEGRPVHPASFCSVQSNTSSVMSNARNNLVLGKISRESYDKTIHKMLLTKTGLLRGHVTSLTVEGSLRLVIVPRKNKTEEPLNTVSIPLHVAENCKVPYWNTLDKNTGLFESHEVRYSGIRTGDVGLMIRYPTLSSGSAIPVNIVVGGTDDSMGFSLELTRSYNADYDGDECVVCIVRTVEGVRECKSILHSSTRPFRNLVMKRLVCNATKRGESHGFLWETGFSYAEALTITFNDLHKSVDLNDHRVSAFQKSFKEVASDEERYYDLVKYNNKSVSKTGIQSNSGYLGRVGRIVASNFITDSEGAVSLISDNQPVLLNKFKSVSLYPSYGIPSIRAISKLTRKITQSSLTKKSAKDDLNVSDGVDLISELISGCNTTLIYVCKKDDLSTKLPKIVSKSYVLREDEVLYAASCPRIINTNFRQNLSFNKQLIEVVSRGMDLVSLAGSFTLEEHERNALVSIVIVLAQQNTDSLLDYLNKRVRDTSNRNVRLTNTLHSSWYNNALVSALTGLGDYSACLSAESIFEMCFLCNYSAVASISQVPKANN